MGFWIFMLAMCLLIPATMIGIGNLFTHKPPKKINFIYGYRTSMSMKNKDTWDFAHRHSGELWRKIGLILAGVSAIAMLFALGRDNDFVANFGQVVTLVQCVVLVLSIIPTEIALKKTFDKSGHRR